MTLPLLKAFDQRFRELRALPDLAGQDSAIKQFLFNLALICFIEERTGLSLSQFKEPRGDLRASLKRYADFFKEPFFLDGPLKEISSTELSKLCDLISELKPNLDENGLAGLYEHFLSPHDPNKTGLFYTPQSMVAELTDRALERFQTNSKTTGQAPTVLDPACGIGVFLIQAFKRLVAERSFSDFEKRRALLCSSIYGIERDELAARIARVILAAQLYRDPQQSLILPKPPDLSANVVIGNALLASSDFSDAEAASRLSAQNWRNIFGQQLKKGGFDCIIGNPPYGLARDEQLSSEENTKLKELYSAFRVGKLNKYLLFMAKSYEWLSPKGVLCFIVPNAWLGINAGKAMRALFLKDRALTDLYVYRYPVFSEPGVENVSFVVQKGARANSFSVFHCDSPSIKASPSFTLPTAFCLKDPEQRIPIFWSNVATDLFEYLSESCINLGSAQSGFISRIALQAYLCGKGDPPQTRADVEAHIFDRDHKQDEQTLPYLEGRDIKRFELNWSGKYLRYGPWLAEPQRLEWFSGPRIVIREIISGSPYLLSAAYLEELMLYNKSVLHILPTNTASEKLMPALLAILNSKLAAYVIRMRGRKSQRRLFPKIVNADLSDFPLPKDFGEQANSLADLANERLKRTPNNELDRELDKNVYKLYRLNSEQINEIELS